MGCANFKLLQISTDSRATIVLIDDARSTKREREREREKERDFGKVYQAHNSVDAIPRLSMVPKYNKDQPDKSSCRCELN
jgi:hypothetical protein